MLTLNVGRDSFFGCLSFKQHPTGLYHMKHVPQGISKRAKSTAL